MKNWRKLTVGDQVRYSWNEFDGSGAMIGTVSEITGDHAIISADGVKLWLDDDTCGMFRR